MMITIAQRTARYVRRVAPRLRRPLSRRPATSLTARLTTATWGPLGELRLQAVIEGGRPGPHLIGELRHRGRWSLVGFPVRRVQRQADGATVEGTIPRSVLGGLAPGRHDLSITALVGRQRHLLRLAAEPEISLPDARDGVRLYTTSRGNASVSRHGARSPAGAETWSSWADPRTVDEELAGVVRELTARLASHSTLGPCDLRYRFPRPDQVRLDGLYPGSGVCLLLRHDSVGLQPAVLGTDRVAQKFLRNVLVHEARMVIEDGDQLHLLASLALGRAAATVADQLVATLEQLLDRMRLYLDAGPRPQEHGLVPAQWWDAKPNFGDVLGPFLIESLTGRPAINVRSFPSEDPGLFTVGSIAAHLSRPGARIWGSGLMGELSAARAADLSLNPPRSIHAVRGAHTRRVMQDVLGWQVPEVLGDPGLLLPRFYTPRTASEAKGKVALVPHYMHRPLLPRHLDDDIFVVDVRQGPEVVMDQISAARACISSSLHGLVVAQAWEVPWAWLRVGDAQLHGDRFKFEDFYTVLDRDAVTVVDLPRSQVCEQDWTRSAGAATVPSPRFDAERLIAAFPAL